MNEECSMKTETVPARILSPLSLPLCLAILLIFPLSACGGDTPHVPTSEPQEWSDRVGGESAARTAEADALSNPESGEYAAWEADAAPESAADGGSDDPGTTALQPSNRLLITQDEESNETLSERKNGGPSPFQWVFLIAVALWMAYDIHFKRTLLRKRKKAETGTPKSVRNSQNAEPFREREQEQRIRTLEARIAELELAEQHRKGDSPDEISRDSGKLSAILSGTRLGPQNPEELESRNYDDPHVRLINAPQGNLEIVDEAPHSNNVFVLPVLNEKTSDSPLGGVISRKSLCYSVIRSCFRVSRFPPDGLDRVNVTISKPAQLQRHDGYYTVKDMGEIIVK